MVEGASFVVAMDEVDACSSKGGPSLPQETLSVIDVVLTITSCILPGDSIELASIKVTLKATMLESSEKRKASSM